MANEPIVPVEGTQDKGFFEEGGFLSRAADKIDGFFGGVGTLAKDIAVGTKDIIGNTVTKIATGDFDFNSGLDDKDFKKYKNETPISDYERQLSKESADIGGMEMGWDIIKGLWAGGKNLVTGSPLSNKLNIGINEKDFNEKLKTHQDDLEATNKIITDIISADPKFSKFRDFESVTRTNYLKARGITSIQDEDDYGKFKGDEIRKMNALDQQAIFSQYTALQGTVAKYEIQMKQKQEAMDGFINQSVKTEGEKTSKEVFEQAQKEMGKQFNGNRYFEYTQKINDKVQKEFTEEMEKDGRSISGMGKSFKNLEDNIVEQISAAEMYRINLIGMKDFPENEKYAAMVGDANNSFKQFNYSFIRRLSQAKDLEENKGVDEVTLREKIHAETWRSMSEEDRVKMRGRESLVTGISTMINNKEWTDRSILNPKAWGDGLTILGTGFQSYVDQAYDHNKNGVPHYISQETRGLLYSDEGNLRKLGSMMYYNSDALVSLLIPIKGIGPFQKGAEKISDLLAKNVDKMFKIPVNVGFSQGTLKVIPNGAKGLFESVVTGGISDPVFDNLMMEAPTQSIEAMNLMSNLFFDSFIPGIKGVNRGYQNTKTPNNILYNFFHKDEVAAVKDFTDMVNARGMNGGTAMTIEEGRVALEKGAKLYGNMYDPKEIKNIMDQKGGLYRFLADNVPKMSENGITEMLTGNGLGIRIEDIVGIPRKEFNDFNNLIDLNSKYATSVGDETKARAVGFKIEQTLNTIDSFIRGKGHLEDVIVSRETMTDPLFIAQAKAINGNINQIRVLLKEPGKEQEVKDLIFNVDAGIRNIKGKFTNKITQTKITLVDTATKKEIQVSVDDLKESLDGKNFLDILQEGKIEITKNIKDAKAGSYAIKGLKYAPSVSYVDNFIKSIDQDILDFENKIGIKLDKQEIRGSISSLFNGGKTKFSFVENLSKENYTQKVDEVGVFINDMFRKFYGANIVDDKPYYIGPKLIVDDILIPQTKAHPGKIHVTYGNIFADESLKGKTTSIFYLTYGSEMQHDAFSTKLNIDLSQKTKKEIKGEFSRYVQNIADINKLIIKYGVDDAGVFDFEKGLQRAMSIESTGNIVGLFVNGKLLKKGVSDIIAECIDTKKFTKESIKELENFVYGIFSEATESNAFVIKPMIYSLVAKYADSKPLIDELFKRFNIKNDNFIEAFSNILISPKSYDDIADRIGKRGNQEVLIENFTAKHQDAWDQYVEKLKHSIHDLNRQIEKAKLLRNNQTSQTAAGLIDAEIGNLNDKVKSIESVLKKRNSFITTEVTESLRNINVGYLKAVSKEFAFTKLVGEKMGKAMEEPQKKYEEFLSMRDSIKGLSDNKKKIIEDFIEDISNIDNAETIQNLLRKYEQMEMPDDTRAIVDSIAKHYLHKGDGIEIFDEKNIARIMENMEGRFTKEFALENNQFSKWINAWLGGTNTSRDEVMEKKIAEYYNMPEILSADDLYHSNGSDNKFKKMIDSLIATNSSDDISSIVYNTDKDNTIESLISYIFNGRKLDTTEGDVAEILIGDLLNDQKIINKFKSIANKYKNEEDINISLVKSSTGFGKNIKILSPKYNERIIQIDNMRAKIGKKDPMNIKVINGFSTSGAGSLLFGEGENSKSLTTLYNQWALNKFHKSINSKSDDIVKGAYEYSYVTSSDKYELMARLINNNTTDNDINILLPNVNLSDLEPSIIANLKEELRQQALKQMGGIPDDHVFVGNFGDKDSTFVTYKSGLDIYDKDITPFDKSQIELSIYKYEYAFANGYINNSSKIVTFKDFSKKFLKGPFTDFESYKNYIHDKVYTKKGVDPTTLKVIRVNKYILSRDKIRKRESFNMSNNKTFEEYKKDVKVFVIEELLKRNSTLDSYQAADVKGGKYNFTDDDFSNILNKTQDQIDLMENKNDYLMIKGFIEMMNRDKMTNAQKNNMLNDTFNKDLQDGTSFTSNNLAEIRAEIQGGKKGLDNFKKGYRQFKDHFFGDIGGKRFGAKTLFNAAEIKVGKDIDSAEELHDAIVVGSGSMKLDGGYKEYTAETSDKFFTVGDNNVYYKEIYINGKMYRATGYVEGTDTSFFKNAASDSYKKEDEVSMSDSIKSRLPLAHSIAIETQQKELIKKEVEIFTKALTDSNISSNSYGDVTELIKVLSSETKIGMGSDAILKGKVNDFLTNIDQIINKPKDPGKALYIMESNLDISPNEVIMSKNSVLVKQMHKDIDDQIALLDKDTDADIIKQLQDDKINGLHTIGYRYPVPSIYNLGVYKILIQEEISKGDSAYAKKFKQYDNMGTEAVVPHPFATYIKLQGDNDGDHLYFISAASDMGIVLGNAALGRGPTDELYEFLKGGNWENNFSVSDEVEKTTGLDGEDINLLQSRNSALNAKGSLSIVSATLRTMEILKQLISVNTYDDMVVVSRETGLNAKDVISVIDKDITIADIRNMIPGLEKILNDPKYAALAGSLINSAVDFGNSGKTEYLKNWFIALLDTAKIPEAEAAIIYHNIISPLAMGYGSGKIGDMADLSQAYKDSKKVIPKKIASKYSLPSDPKDKKYEKKYDKLDSYTKKVIGSKRELYRYIFEEPLIGNDPTKMKSIASLITAINQTEDHRFIVGTMMAGSTSEKVKDILNFMQDKSGLNMNLSGEFFAISKGNREKLAKRIESVGHTDSFKGFLKLIKDYSTEEDYILKTKIGERISTGLSGMEKNEEHTPLRHMATLYAAANGEYALFKYFSIPDKIKYLLSSDERFVNGIGKNYGLELPVDYIKFDEFKKNITNNIDEIKKLISEEDNQNVIIDLEKQLQDHIEAIDEVNAAIAENDTFAKLDMEETPLEANRLDLNYDSKLPEFTFEDLDRSPQAINEILSQHTDMVTLARDGLKFTMQGIFNKYTPRLTANFDNLNSFLAAKDRILSNASDENVRQFGDMWFGYRNSIRKQLEKSGLNERDIGKLSLRMQHLLLNPAGRGFSKVDNKNVVAKLTPAFEEFGVAHLMNSSNFMKEVLDYNDKVMTVAVNKLNEVQTIFPQFDINKSYKNPDLSLVTDLFEAHKADPQFALKLTGIENQADFEAYVRNNAELMGVKIWDSTVRMMVKTVYKNTTGLDKILNFVKGIHYQMTYGTMATLFTQNNIVAGLTQIYPNIVELRAFIGRNPDALREGGYLISKYKFLESEDVLMSASGFTKNLKSSAFEGALGRITKDSVSGALGLVGLEKNKAKRAGEVVDSIFNNMLGFNDYPMEHTRKVIAAYTAMKQMGYKNVDQFDDAIEAGGKDFEMAFHSTIRRNFANSGGGVVSSSQIASGTVFELADEILPHFITRFAVGSLSYLMGWSFHKAATLIEKESALFTGLHKLVNGDVPAFKAHAQDWLTYNGMMVRQIAITTGIYLKFQKYEKDNEDRVTLDSFQRQFNNAYVSVLIPLERHFQAYEKANEFGSGTDAALYTINSVFKNMTRLFKQGAFFSTMYDRYKTQEALGEGDVMESFQYAMDNHYTSYMRFSGMAEMNDLYKSLALQSNLAVMGVGGATSQDEFFNDVSNGKTFTTWKDKGFISSLLSGFATTFDTNIGINVSTNLTQDLRNIIANDPEISKLLKGGQIGTGIQDYNLATLFGNKGSMSEEEQGAASALWKEISYYKYNNIDKNGKVKIFNKEGELIEQSKMQLLLEDRITTELAKKGVNIQDLLLQESKYTPELIKTLAVLSLDSELKTPLVVATLMEMEYKKLLDKNKDKQGKLTGELSKYGTAYKELSQDSILLMQREIMMKYQEYFNLDTNIVSSIMEKHIGINNKPLFEKLEKEIDMKFIKQDLYDMVGREYVARQAMNNGDTKVSALQTRYALIFKGIKSTETGAQVILKALNDIEGMTGMDAKSKLANQAAMLMSLNKTQYKLLSDNKEFQKLTEDSQKQLTNWMLKVSSDSLDFDGESLMTGLNQAAGTSKATGGRKFGKLLPAFASKSFGGQRPNFSNQFAPMREMIPGKERFVSPDPARYIKMKKAMMPQDIGFNPAKFAIVQEFAKISIQGAFYGFESKGIIKSGTIEKKGEPAQKTTVKLAKAKKAKGSKDFKKFTKPVEVSRGMNPNLPLANMGK